MLEIANSFVSMMGNYICFKNRKILPVEKINSSVIFVECTELTWNGKYANYCVVLPYLKTWDGTWEL